ncbi:hypothetical protein CONLIGDRAFT_679534 [Coniochaeta ligniaria NRRL 30616]|uniref:Uncharacterized protein n=1 Tax=Coniochaeta ligniaria NRRL 30616 TaxID=1408157 RepID=A0A1J7JLN8_9PEZI|nr:hypothetical protein CONLIGDRAFT_679534 [Coniochaeta ligniaria NRRL 30616]
MAKRTLYLVTYDRGTYDTTGKVKPHHWSFFIQKEVNGGKDMGIAHQLHGMPGAFYYTGPEVLDLAESGPRKEELEIGEVDDSRLCRVHEILQQVRIDTVESSGWNCQDWALDGLERLKEEGFVYDYLTQETVKHWLRE